MIVPMPICRRLFKHEIWCALDFALANAGNNIAAKMAMMAMTTRSSISVKADFCGRNVCLVFIGSSGADSAQG